MKDFRPLTEGLACSATEQQRLGKLIVEWPKGNEETREGSTFPLSRSWFFPFVLIRSEIEFSTKRSDFKEAPSSIKILGVHSFEKFLRSYTFVVERVPSDSVDPCQKADPVPTSWFSTILPVYSTEYLAGLLHPATDPGVRHVRESSPKHGFPSFVIPLLRDVEPYEVFLLISSDRDSVCSTCFPHCLRFRFLCFLVLPSCRSDFIF